MNDLKNWVPYKLQKVNGQLLCYWLNTYGEPFTEPFFDGTISKCRSKEQRNFKFSSVSSLSIIKDWVGDLVDVEPTAIIFHISRCGSTLISQMLATSGDNIVLSEVPFFDDILRLPFKAPDLDGTEIDDLLLSALKYYSQAGAGDAGPKGELFIKADSWHLFFYEQLRRLFPLVPFILMYRSPDEVFRSHRKQPGMQSVPGLIEPEIFGINNEDILNKSADIYLATVLENYLNKCFEIATTDVHSLLINYNEGPMEIVQKIADFIHLSISESDHQKMLDRSRYHSKNPNERFHEEEVKNTPPFLSQAMELYNKVEQKRKTHSV